MTAAYFKLFSPKTKKIYPSINNSLYEKYILRCTACISYSRAKKLKSSFLKDVFFNPSLWNVLALSGRKVFTLLPIVTRSFTR